MSQERDSQLEEEERGRRTREETFFWCWPPMSSTHFRIERSAANMEDDRKKKYKKRTAQHTCEEDGHSPKGFSQPVNIKNERHFSI